MEGGMGFLAFAATVVLAVIAYQLWVANTPIRAQRKAEDERKNAQAEALVESQIEHLMGKTVQVGLKLDAQLIDNSVGTSALSGDLHGVLIDADDEWIALETERKGIVKLIRIDQIARISGIRR